MLFMYTTDVSGQQQLTDATCTALDMLIENRNNDRVENCMRGENCGYLVCSIISSGGANLTANVTFTTCTSPFAAALELVVSVIDAGQQNATVHIETFISNSTVDTAIELTSTFFVNITVKQLDNGVRFGVRY